MMLGLVLAAVTGSLPARVEREPDRTVVVATAPKEKPRIRGGFSVGGGLVVGSSVDVGGNAAIALRLGAQINRWLGVHYQNSPNLFAYGNRAPNKTIVGFIDMNSVLLAIDLGDHLEISAGPSLDIAELGGCDVPNVRCDTTRGVAPGVHGRAAFLLGGRDPETGRRIGFALGLDAHPIFFQNTEPVMLLGLNLGMEIY